MAMLQLEPATSSYEHVDGNITRRPESHFLDFVIDGMSLRHAVDHADDMVTLLNRPWLHTVSDSIEVLRGRQPQEYLPAGRIPLLVCKVDGDLECGALTAALHVGETDVTWSELRWGDLRPEAEPVVSRIAQCTFDRRQYEAVFADAYERVAAFPYDELAHHGRRFRWPWQWGW